MKMYKNMESFGLFQATLTLTLALIEFHPLTSVIFLSHIKNVPCNKHDVVSPILNIKMPEGRPHKPFSFSCQWQISLSCFGTLAVSVSVSERVRFSAAKKCNFKLFQWQRRTEYEVRRSDIVERPTQRNIYTTTRTIGGMYAPSVMTQRNVKFTQCFQLMQQQAC